MHGIHQLATFKQRARAAAARQAAQVTTELALSSAPSQQQQIDVTPGNQDEGRQAKRLRTHNRSDVSAGNQRLQLQAAPPVRLSSGAARLNFPAQVPVKEASLMLADPLAASIRNRAFTAALNIFRKGKSSAALRLSDVVNLADQQGRPAAGRQRPAERVTAGSDYARGVKHGMHGNMPQLEVPGNPLAPRGPFVLPDPCASSLTAPLPHSDPAAALLGVRQAAPVGLGTSGPNRGGSAQSYLGGDGSAGHSTGHADGDQGPPAQRPSPVITTAHQISEAPQSEPAGEAAPTAADTTPQVDIPRIGASLNTQECIWLVRRRIASMVEADLGIKLRPADLTMPVQSGGSGVGSRLGGGGGEGACRTHLPCTAQVVVPLGPTWQMPGKNERPDPRAVAAHAERKKHELTKESLPRGPSVQRPQTARSLAPPQQVEVLHDVLLRQDIQCTAHEESDSQQVPGKKAVPSSQVILPLSQHYVGREAGKGARPRGQPRSDFGLGHLEEPALYDHCCERAGFSGNPNPASACGRGANATGSQDQMPHRGVRSCPQASNQRGYGATARWHVEAPSPLFSSRKQPSRSELRAWGDGDDDCSLDGGKGVELDAFVRARDSLGQEFAVGAVEAASSRSTSASSEEHGGWSVDIPWQVRPLGCQGLRPLRSATPGAGLESAGPLLEQLGGGGGRSMGSGHHTSPSFAGVETSREVKRPPLLGLGQSLELEAAWSLSPSSGRVKPSGRPPRNTSCSPHQRAAAGLAAVARPVSTADKGLGYTYDLEGSDGDDDPAKIAPDDDVPDVQRRVLADPGQCLDTAQRRRTDNALRNGHSDWLVDDDPGVGIHGDLRVLRSEGKFPLRRHRQNPGLPSCLGGIHEGGGPRDADEWPRNAMQSDAGQQWWNDDNTDVGAVLGLKYPVSDTPNQLPVEPRSLGFPCPRLGHDLGVGAREAWEELVLGDDRADLQMGWEPKVEGYSASAASERESLGGSGGGGGGGGGGGFTCGAVEAGRFASPSSAPLRADSRQCMWPLGADTWEDEYGDGMGLVASSQPGAGGRGAGGRGATRGAVVAGQQHSGVGSDGDRYSLTKGGGEMADFEDEGLGVEELNDVFDAGGVRKCRSRVSKQQRSQTEPRQQQPGKWRHNPGLQEVEDGDEDLFKEFRVER